MWVETKAALREMIPSRFARDPSFGGENDAIGVDK
jgi:hypothetical protein